MRPRCGKLRDGDCKHTHRLARNGIGGIRATPRLDGAVFDRRTHEHAAKATLLGIANGKLCIRREEEQRLLMRLEVMVDVGHPDLLIAPQKRTETVAGLDTAAQQVCTGV